MANMNYCRWQNTESDLQDCIDVVDEHLDFEEYYAKLSDAERRAFKRLWTNAYRFMDELSMLDKGLDVLDELDAQIDAD